MLKQRCQSGTGWRKQTLSANNMVRFDCLNRLLQDYILWDTCMAFFKPNYLAGKRNFGKYNIVMF